MVSQFLESPSLYPEIIERATPPSKGEHAYYRRRSDGWILTAGAWQSMKADMEFKGLDYLPKYGVFTYGTPWGDTNKDRTGRNFNAIAEPWRLIFQTPGGAEEFPVTQIIAYRWHIRPPYREVKFPRLDGIEVFDFFCPECETGIFSAVEQTEALEQLRIHLTSRTNDAHSYRPEDLRALGQELDIDFFAPRRRRSARQAPASIEAQVLEAPVIDVTVNSDVVKKDCPVCGEPVTVAFGHYTRHIRAHQQAGGKAPDSEGVGLNE